MQLLAVYPTIGFFAVGIGGSSSRWLGRLIGPPLMGDGGGGNSLVIGDFTSVKTIFNFDVHATESYFI